MLSIGLMSGTSMDAIDVALLETDGTPERIEMRDYLSFPYDIQFQWALKATEYIAKLYHGDLVKLKQMDEQVVRAYGREVLGLSDSAVEKKLKQILTYLKKTRCQAILSFEEIVFHSSYLHAEAVKAIMRKHGLSAPEVGVIGYHGQTLLHEPAKSKTLIVGDSVYLANTLKIKVVDDFRSKDIQAGGQGAPLAPIYHLALAVRKGSLPLAVVNCGGLANVSFIHSEQEHELIAFDTGPGNALIDSFVRRYTQGKESMDKDGQYGRRGTVNKKLLSTLFEKAVIQDGKNYFSIQPPKSLDYNDVSLIPELYSVAFEDACRTLEAFTAASIVNSIQWLMACPFLNWVVVGGGWQNPVILHEFQERLEKQLPSARIWCAQDMGWMSQAIEAQTFAYLAVRSLQNKPFSFPGTTGVPQPLTGGRCIFPG